jgi:hypothetical protein
MILISHRGNLIGPEPEFENSPQRIDECIENNFQVEIDLRFENNKFYLGHDATQYEVDSGWLIQRNQFLWVHCKDHLAFSEALKLKKLNCFWHNIDDYTMTNFGYVWAYPGKKEVGNLCIGVMPELHNSIEEIVKMKYFGVCSDFVQSIQDHINTK